MVQIKVASPTGLFLSTLPQIRRHGLLGQRCNRLVRAHPRLRGRAQVADGHRILARLLAADGQERQDLRQRVLPHLVVDLLVAQIGLDPEAPLLRLRREGELKFVSRKQQQQLSSRKIGAVEMRQQTRPLAPSFGNLTQDGNGGLPWGASPLTCWIRPPVDQRLVCASIFG